jgi:ParB-like chromosome segregation protein Spo0J
VNQDHLAQIVALAGDWPPILVRCEDHAILDGHYRYMAARQLGHTHIDCVFFQGCSNSAFVEALRRNLRHGLPLSLKEREEAGRRLLTLYPDWSDRRIAQACCLSPGTVARLREVRPGDLNGHVGSRTGRDGRRYPTNRSEARERIIDALQAQPASSLRQVARLTGTSPATVGAVRADLAHPSPGTERTAARTKAAPDPALSSSVEGVKFLGWFERAASASEWPGHLASVPLSRVYEVADEARRRARDWLDFATALEARARPSSRTDPALP